MSTTVTLLRGPKEPKVWTHEDETSAKRRASSLAILHRARVARTEAGYEVDAGRYYSH